MEVATTYFTVATTSVYTYNAAGQLTRVNQSGKTYDNRGNLRTDGAWTYTYDGAGRMVRATTLTQTQVYTYNGDGLRVAQAFNGVETRFTWDQALALPQVLATSGGAKNVYGLGLAGVQQGGTWSYPHTDALGSVRQWTNVSGAVVGTASYGPFGLPLVREGTLAAPWGFAGEWQDPLDATGLQYLRARWYNPATGRFTQVDPFAGMLAQPGTLNPYTYALNNPVMYTDPSGWYSGDSVIGLMAYGGSGPWPWGPFVAHEIRSGNPGISPPNPELAKELSLNAAFLDVFAFGININGGLLAFATNAISFPAILEGSSIGPGGVVVATTAVSGEVMMAYAPFNAVGKFLDGVSFCISSIADIAGGYTYLDAGPFEFVLGQDLSMDLFLSSADFLWGGPIGDMVINGYSLMYSWQSLSKDPTWETRVSIHGIRIISYMGN